MSRKRPVNLAASVQQRLLNLSRERGEDYTLLVTRYALERFLYRLSISEYASNFVIKGAFRFTAWTDQVHRPTRDLDLAGYGEESPEALRKIVFSLCCLRIEPDDGLIFDAETIRI